MHEQLIARMRDYLDAGLAMDIDAFERLYDDEFENVRVDDAGRTVTLTKQQFIDRFRALEASGQRLGESVDDVSFPASTKFGEYGAIVMRRVEGGVTANYLYVWKLRAGTPSTLLRELTFDRDLGYLIQALATASA
jgi:hypothetical protein